MSDSYILDGKKPVRCTDLARWGRWFERDRDARRVARTEVDGGVEVSTVFLGLDHRFGCGDGPPILFETLVFGGPMDGQMERYSTWEEAEAGHAAMVERVRAANPFGDVS